MSLPVLVPRRLTCLWHKRGIFPLSSFNLELNFFPCHLRTASGGTWAKMVKEEPEIDYFDVQD